jgi:hypothetical protein
MKISVAGASGAIAANSFPSSWRAATPSSARPARWLLRPGTGISAAPDAVMAAQIRKRKFPIIGGGGGVWSLVHIADAIERGKPGIHHVADDEPAPVRDWLPYLVRVLGAEPPRRVPAWLARSWPAGRRCT